MELAHRIAKLKEEKLREIAESAKMGDVSSIVANTRTIEAIEKLQTQLAGISAAVDALERPPNNQRSGLIDSNVSGKARGKMRRMEFAEMIRHRGMEASPIKRVVYKVDGRKIVGIAYASERKRAPNVWFLGLPRQDYDAMVMLCEDEYAKVTTFIFPKEFYQKHKDSFSHSSPEDGNEQFKFNITLMNGHYTIRIPGEGQMYINEYIDAFENLGVHEANGSA